ncbi:H-NS histone family protein [Rhabdochromatium marinum]|uniref:H-NS histone family protein n=1 Tax=Rhabdochromatium marinum TaxID=48729 RepID=UPI00190450DF|nr:H-NS histone family protein [Rhabdochromatium marinum]MBK1647835.1 DNA-binding protein [Rhabdochromatium marinum]
MDDMEYTELNEKLQTLEAEQKEVKRALASKRDKRKAELIAEFKQKFIAEGFTVAEMVDTFAGRRSRKPYTERSYSRYIDKADPDRTYARGPLPGWMKERMITVGLDPNDKGDRERYKQDYMQQAQAKHS